MSVPAAIEKKVEEKQDNCQVYCTFADCKKPNGHHNTAKHLCGNCKQLGHSRALCGENHGVDVHRAYEKDGRGQQTCRICESSDHITLGHVCEHCGIMWNPDCCETAVYVKKFNEGIGDFIPEVKWCKKMHTPSGINIRIACAMLYAHTHNGNNHLCKLCGFKNENNIQHHHKGAKCPVCNNSCLISGNKEFVTSKSADRACDNCTVLIKAGSLPKWEGMVVLNGCNHAVCADCLSGRFYPQCDAHERNHKKKYHVEEFTDDEAKMLLKFELPTDMEAVFKMGKQYILLRSHLKSTPVVRSIKHLNKDEQNKLMCKLMSLGFEMHMTLESAADVPDNANDIFNYMAKYSLSRTHELFNKKNTSSSSTSEK